MKRIFLLFGLFWTSLIFAELPEAYRGIWPNFCFEHLLQDPAGCSEWYQEGQSIKLKFDVLGFANCYIDQELVLAVKPQASLIPKVRCRSNECCYETCRDCGKTVLNKVVVYSEDEEGEQQVALAGKCDCNQTWWVDEVGGDWQSCIMLAVPFQFFDWHHKTYHRFLLQLLQYVEENPTCDCYWPYISAIAGQINNQVYRLGFSLAKEHKLCELLKHHSIYLKSRTPHGAVSGLIIPCFFFSHYQTVLQDIAQLYRDHALDAYQEIDASLLSTEKEIREHFLTLYDNCLRKHPHPKILDEREKLLFEEGKDSEYVTENNHFSAEEEIEFLFDSSRACCHEFLSPGVCQRQAVRRSQMVQHAENIDPFAIIELQELANPSREQEFVTTRHEARADWFMAECYFWKAELSINLLLYQQAILELSKAISCNPQYSEAYLLRAHVYFELGNIQSALADYQMFKATATKPPFVSAQAEIEWFGVLSANALYNNEYPIEFCHGLCHGVLLGSQEGMSEFVPSIISSFRGILNGLWAFACAPQEISLELISAVNDIYAHVRSNCLRENLEIVIPELRELCLEWDVLPDRARGYQIGYILGKYGTDVFLPGAVVKAAGKYKTLKRANTLFTLECCAASEAKKAKILEASAKRTIVRQQLVEASKHWKIVVQDFNRIHHIMDPKHSWNKLIQITGDKMVDFQKVTKLLEESGIMLKCYRLEDETKPVKNGLIFIHEVKIKNQEVRAVFFKRKESEELLLSNAWVETP